jgi:hypothetical protein
MEVGMVEATALLTVAAWAVTARAAMAGKLQFGLGLCFVCVLSHLVALPCLSSKGRYGGGGGYGGGGYGAQQVRKGVGTGADSILPHHGLFSLQGGWYGQ